MKTFNGQWTLCWIVKVQRNGLSACKFNKNTCFDLVVFCCCCWLCFSPAEEKQTFCHKKTRVTKQITNPDGVALSPARSKIHPVCRLHTQTRGSIFEWSEVFSSMLERLGLGGAHQTFAEVQLVLASIWRKINPTTCKDSVKMNSEEGGFGCQLFAGGWHDLGWESGPEQPSDPATEKTHGVLVPSSRVPANESGLGAGRNRPHGVRGDSTANTEGLPHSLWTTSIPPEHFQLVVFKHNRAK